LRIAPVPPDRLLAATTPRRERASRARSAIRGTALLVESVKTASLRTALRGTCAAPRWVMKDDMIDAMELLRTQHEEVDSLIEEIEDCEDTIEKMELFTELADKVAAHSIIEERIFYPSVMDDQTHELLLESVEEHLAVKRVLADMLELDIENEHFDAKLAVLKETFRHHAHDEEEGELFPLIKKLMSRDELAALGNEMLALYEMVLEREPRKQVPAETVEAVALTA
jgi:hypothetical protein